MRRKSGEIYRALLSKVARAIKGTTQASLSPTPENESRLTSDDWVAASFRLFLGRDVDQTTIASRIHISKKNQIKRLIQSTEFAETVIPQILEGVHKTRKPIEVDSEFLLDVSLALNISAELAQRLQTGQRKICRIVALEEILILLSRSPNKLETWLSPEKIEARSPSQLLLTSGDAINRIDQHVSDQRFDQAFVEASSLASSGSAIVMRRYLALYYHLCWDLLAFREVLRSAESKIPQAFYLSLFNRVSSTILNEGIGSAENTDNKDIGELFPTEYLSLLQREMSIDAIESRFALWAVLKNLAFKKHYAPTELTPIVWIMPDTIEAREFVQNEPAFLEHTSITAALFGGTKPPVASERSVLSFETYQAAAEFVRNKKTPLRLIATDRPISIPLDALRISSPQLSDIPISVESLELHPEFVGLSDIGGRATSVIGFVSNEKSPTLSADFQFNGLSSYAQELLGDRIVSLEEISVREAKAKRDIVLVRLTSQATGKTLEPNANYTHSMSISEKESASTLSDNIRDMLSSQTISKDTAILITHEDVKHHPSYYNILIQSHISQRQCPVSAVNLVESNGRLRLRERSPMAAPGITRIGFLPFCCTTAEDMLEILLQNPEGPLGSYMFAFKVPAIVPDVSNTLLSQVTDQVNDATNKLAKLENGPSALLKAAQDSIYDDIKSTNQATSNTYYQIYLAFKEKAERALFEFTAGDIRKTDQINVLLEADFLGILKHDFEPGDIRLFLKRAFARKHTLMQLSVTGFSQLALYAQKYGVHRECCLLGLADIETVLLNDLSKARAYFQLLNGAISSSDLQAELMRISCSVANARRFRPASARKIADLLSAYATPNTALVFIQKLSSRFDALNESFLSILKRIAHLLSDEDLTKIGIFVDRKSEAIVGKISSAERKLSAALGNRDRPEVVSALNEIGRGQFSISSLLNSLRSYSAELSDMNITANDWPYWKKLDSSDALKTAIALSDRETIRVLTKDTSDKETLAIAGAATGSFAKLNALYDSWAKIDDVAPIKFHGKSIQDVFKSIAEAKASERSFSEEPLISVVMTVFDGPLDLLKLSLKSILNQTFKNVEIILVDDCSSSEISSKYEEAVSEIKNHSYFRLPKNLGPYLGRNFALSKARGEFIAIQDADDFSHPERFAKQIAVLKSNSYLRATTSPNLRFDRNGNIQLEHGLALRGDGTMATMFRSTVFDEIGAFASVRSRGDVEYRERIIKAFGQNAFLKTECPLQFCYAAASTLSQNVARERAQHLADFRTAVDAQSWSLLGGAPLGELPIPTLLRP